MVQMPAKRPIGVFLSVWLLAAYSLAHLLASPAAAQGIAFDTPLRARVLVLDFNPLEGGRPLTESRGWNEPRTLTDRHVSDIHVGARGAAEFQVVEYVTLRQFPVKTGGLLFTEPTYRACQTATPGSQCTLLVDYRSLLNASYGGAHTSPCAALSQGAVDEIWLWGGPWFGYYEHQSVAPGTWCAQARRPFVVMGFNYERGPEEMLHSFAHRVESLVSGGVPAAVWRSFDGQQHRYSQDYARPAAPDAGHPEVTTRPTHCGNVHFPPNAYSHYHYEREHAVESDCDRWLDYPAPSTRTTMVSCQTWGCSQSGYLTWWLNHLPRRRGTTDGVTNNWWRLALPWAVSEAQAPTVPAAPSTPAPAPTAAPPTTALPTVVMPTVAVPTVVRPTEIVTATAAAAATTPAVVTATGSPTTVPAGASPTVVPLWASFLPASFPALAQAAAAPAAPARVPQGSRPCAHSGSVFQLADTPHIFVCGDDLVLHWASDTRGLAGRNIDWRRDARAMVTLEALAQYYRGDPWLSARLVKVGEPIYLVKWETNEALPRLQHIRAIADVELFGIGATNYGRFVLDQATWEGYFGVPIASLARESLAAAVR